MSRGVKNISLVIKELPDCLRLPVALFYLYYKTLQIIYNIPSKDLESFNNFITTDISNNIIPSCDEIKFKLLSEFYLIISDGDTPNFNRIDTGKENLGKSKNDLQGLYFLRNNRVIDYGGWFDLGEKNADKMWASNERYNRLRIEVTVPIETSKDWITTDKTKVIIPGYAESKIRKSLVQIRRDYLETMEIKDRGVHSLSQGQNQVIANIVAGIRRLEDLLV